MPKPRHGAAKAVRTAGQYCADGAHIALVRADESLRPQLLYCNGTLQSIEPRIQHAGTTYCPPRISNGFLRRPRLPGAPGPCPTTTGLFTSIAAVIRNRVSVTDRDAELVTYFALSTWFLDVLPLAPALAISARAGTESWQLLQVLSCLCSRALLLGHVSAADLRSLPAQVFASLMIQDGAMSAKTQRLLAACSYPSMSWLGKRQPVEMFAAVAVASADPIELENALTVSLPPRSGGNLPRLTAAVLDELAAEFQPMLLAYRLQAMPEVMRSSFDVPEFMSPPRDVARSLGLCIADEGLGAHLIDLLRPNDQEARVERSSGDGTIVLEALLLACHENQAFVHVGQIATFANSILLQRGEQREMTAYTVRRVRQELGLITQKIGNAGRGIVLSDSVRQQIHHLAQLHGVFSAQAGGKKTCQHCRRTEDRRQVS